MRFSLDVLRAHKGDCLIVHYGTKEDPHLIMIDGGPNDTFKPHLRPRIETIRDARGLKAKKEPLPVDLMMVSHVDDDHIHGILDLTKELITAQMDSKPQLLQVLSFWHNSFENIIGDTPEQLTASIQKQFPTAATSGELPNDATIDAGHEDEETIVSSLKVLASIEQGAQLRSNVEKLNFELNPEFDGELVLAEKNGKPLDMDNGLKFTVIGPMVPELKQLHKKHQEWLKQLKKKGMTPEEALSAYVDKSVPNLSSIVVLAEADGKRMLLTGDARGDKILEGLELVGLIKKGGKIQVDVLKVPHHGSANNLDTDFFERITADHYVFSGDGQHGNPERESLQMLLDARGGAKYKIHLTYPVKDIDVERKADWDKEQAKEKTKKKKNPKQKVRPDWDPKTNSLTAFFAKHKDFAKKVKVVTDSKPHLINLLDKVDF